MSLLVTWYLMLCYSSNGVERRDILLNSDIEWSDVLSLNRGMWILFLQACLAIVLL